MRERSFWSLAPLVLLLSVQLGCTSQTSVPQQSSSSPVAASPAAGVTIQAAPALPRSSDSPAPAAPIAASPQVTASPAAGPRTQPASKVGYSLPTSISPAYLDPQEYPTVITPYVYGYLIHDALVKHLPGQIYAPSLAESYEIAPDFGSATFRLRPGLKFHNGEPVTPEDVKFSFEKYRGGGAKVLHDATASVDILDGRTIKFTFKAPFPDFLVLYGSAASGAGWIVPAKYYQQVGPDGFKQNPIGAGPYRVVRQIAGTELEVEAVPDYWRKTPPVKTIVIRSIPDDSTRLAALQAGEIDFASQLPTQLIDTIRQDAKLRLGAVLGPSIFVLEFPGFEQPDNIFHDVRIRQAISLGLDRQAISDQEFAGLSPPVGNWIADDVPGALRVPPPAPDLARAKQLLAEAGYPDGFDAGPLTPTSPFRASLAERVLGQLREIGIRGQVTPIDTAAAFNLLLQNQTPNRAKGMFLESPGSAGDAAVQIAASATCTGGRSPKCIPSIEEKWKRYQTSANQQERSRLLEEIQQELVASHVMVPIGRSVIFNAQSARIANEPKDVWGAIPQFVFLGPYEDIQLKG